MRSRFAQLVLGSILTALLIFLGMTGILAVCGFAVTPAIPAVLGAVGGAIYCARTK